MSAKFVDDGEKVAQGADGSQRWSVGIAGEPSCCSQHEGRADEIERDRSAVEFSGHEAVGLIKPFGRDRKLEIKVADQADVMVGPGNHGFFFLAAASISLSRMR